MQSGRSNLKDARERLKMKKTLPQKSQEEIEAMKQEAARAKKHGWNKPDKNGVVRESRAPGAEKSRKEYERLNKEIEIYETNEKELKEQSK
jgi:hypothetical protein